jgi:hypothetical protein
MSYLDSRFERAVVKGLPSVLKNPATRWKALNSGSAGSHYLGALDDANRAGRTLGRKANSRYYRNEKGRALFRAKTAIPGSAEAKRMRQAAAPPRTRQEAWDARQRAAIDSDRAAMAASARAERSMRAKYNSWGSLKNAPRSSVGGRENVFNPRSRG